MNKILIILLFPVMVMTACKNTSLSGDEEFLTISEEFIDGYLAWRPQQAVWMGFHEYDGKIADLSLTSIGNELTRLKYYDEVLAGFDTTSLSPEVYFDFRILKSAIKYEIYMIEDIEQYHINPRDYPNQLDLSLYIVRDFAPLEERVRSIIAIENSSNLIFDAARSNLRDMLPRPYVETAIQISRGLASFLETDLKNAVLEVDNDSLIAIFNRSNDKAIEEFNAYASWLEEERLPQSTDEFAIGKENYQKMLLYGEGIAMPVEEILALGLEELEKEQEVFVSMAKVINPNEEFSEVHKDIQKEHPTAENLISDVSKNINYIREFMLDHNIVSVPAPINLIVRETPQFARSTTSAAMNPPGPFEENAKEAYFYVTPVDPQWSEKQKEEWLSSFDYYTTDIVAIHEAYPGHYIQFMHLKNSSASKIEKVFSSYAFVEGWAHYCEKMMLDEGYGDNGDPLVRAKYRLAQSGDALLRLCRLCVSIQMHCQGMTVDEATEFLMSNWYQGETPSRREAIRGTFDPGYLSYTFGKLQMLKLREDYQSQEGSDFSLKNFHDQVLSYGMPPIRLLREKLLLDRAIWDDTL